MVRSRDRESHSRTATLADPGSLVALVERIEPPAAAPLLRVHHLVRDAVLAVEPRDDLPGAGVIDASVPLA